MPDAIEKNLTRILDGLALEAPDAEICDFTIAQQIEAMEAQGLAPNVKSNYAPVLGENLNYIVACVIVNDADEVLMIEEAKAGCTGKWYLPAGRMERCENICDATMREVLEETGLKVDIMTLLLVESAYGSWIRFVMTGKVVGGTLKTPDKADQESLQAKWVKNVDDLPLRAQDIKHLIDRARQFKAARRAHDNSWYPDTMPSFYGHSRVLLRLVVCARKRSTNRLHILINERELWHLPTCEIHPSRSIHVSLRKFMIELFGAEVAQHKPHGLLNLEHDGKSGDKDGSCMTMLVSFRVPLEEVPILAKCVWHEVSKPLGERLLQKISLRNATIPLNVIR